MFVQRPTRRTTRRPTDPHTDHTHDCGGRLTRRCIIGARRRMSQSTDKAKIEDSGDSGREDRSGLRTRALKWLRTLRGMVLSAGALAGAVAAVLGLASGVLRSDEDKST